MANVDDAFLSFLKAYGYTSSLNALDTDVVSQARINAVFGRHKDAFDAWMKCPNWLKDKYHDKIPYDILAKASADPNFTEIDAVRADIEHQKRDNPYSVVPDSLVEHPAYEQLCTCGAVYTAAHVAAMKLMEETYSRGGYSYDNAQKVAAEYAVRGAFLDQKAVILADKTLSEAEKARQLQNIDEQHRLSRLRELEAKKAERRNHPEKTIISWLMRVQAHRMTREEATPQITKKLQQLIDSDKLVLLAEEMSRPKYQNLVSAETKEYFAHILRANGVDPVYMNQTAQDFVLKDVKKPQILQQDPRVMAQIQQQRIEQMRHTR